MDNFDEQISSFTAVHALFGLLDDYHAKQYLDNLEYRENTESELANYLAAANKSMSEMGENYDYHNYDYGREQELRHEEMAALAQQSFFAETKELHSLAIVEMKVMFLYKEVEIRLKKTISTRYKKNTNKLSSLKMLTDYFALKKVNIDQITEYIAVEELRLVTNDLKHSLKINTSNEVPEFMGENEFSSEVLGVYLDRVAYEIAGFFEKLVKLVNGEVVNSGSDEFIGDIPF
ncbi:hypothetical protein [Moritella sp. 28]|uniref:hypothetical protein n=1 Tax=Moritella sp. 28 TaxID=2746232 RepID=UPI001BA72BD4|nr:hypothetical protein [Moritella sp. 28]QUM85979.1 hypothetical protein HWV02_16415 [Moritella sp. 28]